MTATLPSAAAQLDREIQGTLELVDHIREQYRRTEPPGWVLLRAARACWLIGNVDWARNFYRRAAATLSQYALDVGRRSGTFEPYAHAALGAAWMSAQRDVLVDTGRVIDSACEQLITNTELPPDALIRVGLLLTRMRVAWYREQSVLVREYEAEIERRANALDAWTKSFWQAERGILSFQTIRVFSAYRAVATGGSRLSGSGGFGQHTPLEAASAALQAMDRRLHEQRARPATVADLVDEEFLSFVAALAAQAAPLPILRLPVEPGRYSV